MKKIFEILGIFILVLPMIYIPIKVQAQTLGDLKNQLKKQQEELNDANNKKVQTESQINNVNNNISNIKKEINQTYNDIASLNQQIEKLNKDIETKESEIKQIVNFIQISDGESAYLEYISGSQNYEDFIYRISVAEQLSKYNKEMIKEFNDMISQNKQKQKDIEQKRISLGAKQQELSGELSKLGKELETASSTSIKKEDEVKNQKEIIKMYEDMGCKDSESISTCGRNILPPGTAFYRPIANGYVTSEWGTRGSGWHEGIDMGSKTTATPVYAIATGVVATIMPKYSCGGNMVIVHHNINGKTYTSVYAHLLNINVNKGQRVTKDTQIGNMGGGSNTEYYDSCTFGQHLHLTVAKGLYGVDYSSWNAMNYTYSTNPRGVINFPAGRIAFGDRLSKY